MHSRKSTVLCFLDPVLFCCSCFSSYVRYFFATKLVGRMNVSAAVLKQWRDVFVLE